MKVGNLLNLEKQEHLAPKALVTPSGETYAMVAPTITKDNFILVYNQGQARRMDVSDSEGHRMPFVVQTIVEDGGTPWYVEFWNWITGQSTSNRIKEYQPLGKSSLGAGSSFSRQNSP